MEKPKDRGQRIGPVTQKKPLTAEGSENLAECAEENSIRSAFLRELRVISATSAVKGVLPTEPLRRDEFERWIVLRNFGKGIDTCVWLNRKEFLDCAFVAR